MINLQKYGLKSLRYEEEVRIYKQLASYIFFSSNCTLMRLLTYIICNVEEV